jgi:hypothetical protein
LSGSAYHKNAIYPEPDFFSAQSFPASMTTEPEFPISWKIWVFIGSICYFNSAGWILEPASRQLGNFAIDNPD